MLVCKNCNSENPLGRVFCGTCGGKLDLSGMTQDAVMEHARPNIFQLYWQQMVGTVLVLILALVALAFWPQGAPLGEEGTSAGASKVRNRIHTLSNQPSGRRLKGEFEEKDVNSYLKYSRIRRTTIQSFTVEMQPSRMKARLLRPFKTIKLGGKKIVLQISCDVACTPVGGQLYISSAAIGHLPVFGPLKVVAAKAFIKVLSNGDEAKLLSVASEIEIEEGKAVVTVGE